MIKPSMPGMGAMNDTLDFMKSLWGGMGMPAAGMPGMVMPTLSVEEINKKIADLKAVESWLTLNMNMLRSTIQALEVQAATISALQSMGEQFSAGMNAASQAAKDMQSFGAGAASTSSAASSSGSTGSSPFATPAQGAQAFTPPFPFPPISPSAAASAAAPASPTNNAPSPSQESGLQPTSNDQANAANLAAPIVNAAAWWNLLQDQFRQAVSSAMASEPASPSVEGQSENKDNPATTKPAAKSRTKTVPTTSESSAAGTTRKPRASR